METIVTLGGKTTDGRDAQARNRTRMNAGARDAFVQRLAEPGAVERIGDDQAWITGRVTVRGDGTWRPDVLPLHVAKLVWNLRSGGTT